MTRSSRGADGTETIPGSSKSSSNGACGREGVGSPFRKPFLDEPLVGRAVNVVSDDELHQGSGKRNVTLRVATRAREQHRRDRVAVQRGEPAQELGLEELPDHGLEHQIERHRHLGPIPERADPFDRLAQWHENGIPEPGRARARVGKACVDLGEREEVLNDVLAMPELVARLESQREGQRVQSASRTA